jgi:hypothetical protein
MLNVIQVHPNAVCIKLVNPLNGRELSIGADDSCGALSTMRRTEVCVFENEKSMNTLFQSYGCDIDTLKKAIAVLEGQG